MTADLRLWGGVGAHLWRRGIASSFAYGLDCRTGPPPNAATHYARAFIWRQAVEVRRRCENLVAVVLQHASNYSACDVRTVYRALSSRNPKIARRILTYKGRRPAFSSGRGRLSLRSVRGTMVGRRRQLGSGTNRVGMWPVVGLEVRFDGTILWA